MEYLNQRPQKTEDVVSRKIEDQFILIPIRSNVADLDSIYTLNETSTRIYELIDGERTLAQIRDALAKEYEVSREDLAEDIWQMVKQLESIGSIQWKK